MTATRYHEGKFPPENIDWPKILPLIGPASAGLARFEGVLHGVPNSNVLLSPLCTREAVLSSKIEGTQATLGEVLEFEAGGKQSVSEHKKGDIHEVLNYRSALRHAVKMMEKLPLSQRVIKEAHRVLMQGVRGTDKTPGEYRRVANWIGKEKSSMKAARFIPPSPEQVPAAMDAWEKHLHREAPDHLTRLAILHVEFEAIHPFLDGNGRLGRLIVPLYLVEKKLLSEPTFYISEYLEAHREEYYQRLLAVSRDDDWTGWCAFFLTAIVEQAKSNESKAKAILDLYREKKDAITKMTHSQHGIRALDWFFTRPIFQTSDYMETVGIPEATAKRILRLARDHGLLRELRQGKGRRPAILDFPELLSIADSEPTF